MFGAYRVAVGFAEPFGFQGSAAVSGSGAAVLGVGPTHVGGEFCAQHALGGEHASGTLSGKVPKRFTFGWVSSPTKHVRPYATAGFADNSAALNVDLDRGRV